MYADELKSICFILRWFIYEEYMIYSLMITNRQLEMVLEGGKRDSITNQSSVVDGEGKEERSLLRVHFVI